MPRKPSLDILRTTLQRLPLEQQQELYAWLGEVIAQATATPVANPQTQAHRILEQRHYLGKSYQLEKRRCNKAGCACMSGVVTETGHGSYWYCYWKENGKNHSRYVGKRPPWSYEVGDSEH